MDKIFLTQRSQALPLYQQLYTALREAIISGELKRGTQLPSTRALASELNLSRNTILSAYQQLLAEGYLEGVAGSGTYVARVLPESLLNPPAQEPAGETQPGQTPEPRLSEQARRQLALTQDRSPRAEPTRGAPRPFSPDTPGLDAFPYRLWARMVIQQARLIPESAFRYQDWAGYGPLRAAIAAHAAVARQVHCTPEQVVIVPGSQGALDLVVRLLVNPGDAVWIEDPGYIGARGAFLGAGAQVIPVPVDAQGIDVEAGIARAPHARLVYTTPSHQFPLGVTLSAARRLALLEWARRSGAYVLEDDYDSEYRFVGRPLAALQGLDEAQRVIYIGTFSKVLFPALRLGYLILPPPLVEAALAVRRFIDIHPPLLEQAVLAEFLSAGHFSRHVRRMRALYAQRREALLEAFKGLPLQLYAPETGIHCVGWLPEGVEVAALVQAAAKHRLDLAPLSSFYIQPPRRQGLLLGYGGFSAADIRAGAERLAEVLRGW